jgi:hypothetical protein
MSSIAGMNQPVALGTGKFIKHFKLPVYYSVIKGGYLSFPKYTLDEHPGRVEVVIDKMFSSEDLETLTPEEIEDIINKKLYHDDYLWNKVHRHKYKTNGKAAEGLSNLLFWCPKCGSLDSMMSKGDVIWCSNCASGANVDETYSLSPLDENSVIFSTQSEWFNKQRELIKEMVKNDGFSFTEQVKLGTLPSKKPLNKTQTSLITGEGSLTIDKTGLTFIGTNNKQPLTFTIPIKDLPTYGMCTDVSRFYTFYNGIFYEFYPKTRCGEKFFLMTEELHRLNGGKWQDFKFTK